MFLIECLYANVSCFAQVSNLQGQISNGNSDIQRRVSKSLFTLNNINASFFRIVRVAETIGIKIELYGESGIGWLLHAMHVHDHVLSCRTDAVYISLAENLSCVWNDTAITFFLNI